MGATLGLNARLYRQTTGTRATWGTATAGIHIGGAPSNLDAVDSVKNVSYNLTKGRADVSTRGNLGWVAKLGALKDGSFTIEAVWDTADADLVALVSAWVTNANVALALLDGDKATAGTMGIWADFQVMDLNKGEQLVEGQMMTITVEPGYSAVPPEVVKVGS